MVWTGKVRAAEIRLLALAFLVLWKPGALSVRAQEEIEQSARKLIEATVTLRAAGARDYLAGVGDRGEPEAAASNPQEDEITVCSGTYVGNNRLLTFGCLPVIREDGVVETEYRITLPAGRQARARPSVVDRHSGLVLLELEGEAEGDLLPLELAEVLPETGGEVLTAAAAGVEEPLVSLGVLSGIDRIVPGTELPPLLVCDISTTAASSGAALVDREARLLGIIAATSLPGENFGWSYAIPLKHIRRVLDAQEADRVVILARMRPTLGVVLGPGQEVGSIVVQHVLEGGPGGEAGLRAGDQILAIEGRQVRSVYQAGTILRKHLPGERIGLLCISSAAESKPAASVEGEAAARNAAAGERLKIRESAAQHAAGRRLRRVEVTLGAQSDEANARFPANVQSQTIKARFTGPGNVEVSNSVRSYQLALGEATLDLEGSRVEARDGAEAAADGTTLRERLQSYEQLIGALQEESSRHREQLVKREQMIRNLERELAELRSEVAQLPAADGSDE